MENEIQKDNRIDRVRVQPGIENQSFVKPYRLYS